MQIVQDWNSWFGGDLRLEINIVRFIDSETFLNLVDFNKINDNTNTSDLLIKLYNIY